MEENPFEGWSDRSSLKLSVDNCVSYTMWLCQLENLLAACYSAHFALREFWEHNSEIIEYFCEFFICCDFF